MTLDTHSMKRRAKLEKKGLLFTVCVITVYDTYNGPCFPFWQHTTELSFVFLSLPLGMHENNTITALKHGQTVCYTFVHFHLPTWADLLKNTGLSHSLISESQTEGFLNRVEFLTWKLALNPICTGRHIFGQSSATADRENEPSVLHYVAWLLSYLPPQI